MMIIVFYSILTFDQVSRKFTPENYLAESFPLGNCPLWKYLAMNILPYESSPLWRLPPRNLPLRKLPTMKIPPEKINPHEIASPLINHKNERKNKITNLFALKNAMQHNILIKITKVFLDTQMISQKIQGLDTFFTERKKIQRSNETENHQIAFTCQFCKSRKTKTRQSNYGIWQICELLNSQSSLHVTL